MGAAGCARGPRGGAAGVCPLCLTPSVDQTEMGPRPPRTHTVLISRYSYGSFCPDRTSNMTPANVWSMWSCVCASTAWCTSVAAVRWRCSRSIFARVRGPRAHRAGPGAPSRAAGMRPGCPSHRSAASAKFRRASLSKDPLPLAFRDTKTESRPWYYRNGPWCWFVAPRFKATMAARRCAALLAVSVSTASGGLQRTRALFLAPIRPARRAAPHDALSRRRVCASRRFTDPHRRPHGRAGYVAAPAASLRPAGTAGRAGTSGTCALRMKQGGDAGVSRKAAMQLLGLTLAGAHRE